MVAIKPAFLFISDTFTPTSGRAAEYQLQIRTNTDWLIAYSVRGDAQGKLILTVPEPIIPIATGSLKEILSYAHRMFSAVPDNIDGWKYHGDNCWSFCLSNSAD